MFWKIAVGLIATIAIFWGYVNTREGYFRYARSAIINAPADKIYPYLVDFRRGSEWSPYEQKDPNMKKTFKGDAGMIGSGLEFDGNSEVGAGFLQLLKTEPNKSVQIRLHMSRPISADNLIDYTLEPTEGGGTRVTWSMSGDGGFFGKLLGVFIDCEKMVAAEMEKGMTNLKAIVENAK